MNHLFIGLGDVGEKITSSFFNRYSYRIAHQLPHDSPEKDKVIESLYLQPIVSSPSATGGNTAEHQDSYAKLDYASSGDDNRILMPTKTITEFLNAPDKFPIAHALIKSDKPAWQATLKAFSTKQNLQQPSQTLIQKDIHKRRVGRLLFALSYNQIIAKINTLVKNLKQKNGEANVTFHIISNVTEALTSGVLIDLLYHLRKHYPDSNHTTNTIINYAYIPNDIDTGWSSRNHQANGYATLLELNALVSDANNAHNISNDWTFFDIATGKTLSQQQINNRQSAFNSCYIFTDEELSTTTTPHQPTKMDTDLPSMVADFILHKTIMTPKGSWQALLETEQDTANSDSNQQTTSLNPTKFMSFGISRFEFPRLRFHKTLGIELALQFLEQLRYDHLTEYRGYINKPKNDGNTVYINHVHDADVLERWKLSDAYLLLDKPLLPEHQNDNWQAHDLTWMTLARHYRQVAEKNNKRHWTDEFFWLMEHCNQQQYRRVGVKAFFEHMHAYADRYAQSIANIVEKDLISDFRQGTHSITDCSHILSALRVNIDARANKIDNLINRYKEKAYNYHQKYSATKEKIAKAQSSFFTASPSEEDNEAVFAQLQGYYSASTYMQAYQFKALVFDALTPLLTKLYNDFQAIYVLLGQLVQLAEQDHKKHSTSNRSSPNHVHTFGEAHFLQSLRNDLIYDHDTREHCLNTVRQQLFQNAIRPRLKAKAQSQPSLKQWMNNSPENLQHIHNLISNSCFDAIESIHDSNIYSSDRQFLNVSILDKLLHSVQADAKSDIEISLNNDGSLNEMNTPELTKFTEEILNKATSLTKLSDAVINPSDNKTDGYENIANTTAIFMPMTQGYEQQINLIKSAFAQNYKHQNSQTVAHKDLTYIQTPDNDNSITVVSINSNMPLRCFNIVSALKQKYDQRTAHNINNIASDIHIEGDGSQLTGLFITPQKQINTEAFPLIFLAIHSGLIIKKTQGANSDPIWYRYQLSHSEQGIKKSPIKLGNNIFSILTDISEEQVTTLRADLKHHLQDKIPYQQSALEEMLQELHKYFSDIRQHINTRNPEQALMLSKAWNNAIKQSVQIARGQIQL